jgi:hypothetical protein
LRSRLVHRRPTSSRSISGRLISRAVIWSPGRTVSRKGTRGGRTIIRWAIVPIAAISRPRVIGDRARTIPVIRRSIRSSPSHPNGVIVIGSVRRPVPSPTHPSPWPCAHDKDANRDWRSVRDVDRGRRTVIYRRRIVDRHVDDLRVCRLDHIDRLGGHLLYLYGLLLIALQRPRCISLGPQPLDRGTDCSLVGGKCLTDGGEIVDVFCHHVDHVGEHHQGNKCRVKSLLLCRVGKRRAL